MNWMRQVTLMRNSQFEKRKATLHASFAVGALAMLMEHSLVFALLVSTIVLYASTREEAIVDLVEQLGERLGLAAGNGRYVWPLVQSLLLVAFAAAVWSGKQTPSSAQVKETLAVMNPLYWALVTYAAVIRFGRDENAGPLQWWDASVLVLWTFVALNWGVGQFGDSIYRLLQGGGHLEFSGLAILITVLAGTVPVLFLRRPDRGLIGGVERSISGEGGAGMVAAAAHSMRMLSERDRKVVAAHEVGHALALAALEELPDAVELRVKHQEDGSGSLGYVFSGLTSQNILQDLAFIEWRMIMLLCGSVGERKYTNAGYTGNSEDFAKWQAYAHRYLSSQPGSDRGLFYEAPSNSIELEWNEKAIRALCKSQMHLAHQVISQNASLFQEMVETVLTSEDGYMGHEELKSFLERVKLPNGFPLPKEYSSAA